MKHWMWILLLGVIVTFVLKKMGKGFWKIAALGTVVVTGFAFWKSR